MKKCSICEKEYTALWKAKTKEHGAMCKNCWQSFKSPESPDYSKVVQRVKKSKRTSYISPFSDKKLKELSEYRPLRDAYMKNHIYCEVKGCSNKSVELHHKKPRAYHLCDTEVFMAVCRPCHMRIENEDEWARENGYKLNHL